MRSPRSSSVVTVFALVVSLLISLVLSEAALAEDKKVSGTGKFGPTLSQVILFPGDVPKHEVSLFNRLQFWNSADPDWNNVAVTQFVYSDYTAGNGYHRGHNANVHPSGDRTFISYEGQTTRTMSPDGSWEAKFEGKMRFTGGTGKQSIGSPTNRRPSTSAIPRASSHPRRSCRLMGIEEARVPRLVGLGCTAERSPASRASRGPRAIRSEPPHADTRGRERRYATSSGRATIMPVCVGTRARYVASSSSRMTAFWVVDACSNLSTPPSSL